MDKKVAAEIRALSKYPSLASLHWGPCRSCGEWGPTDWGVEGDIHIGCPLPEGEKTYIPRRRKGEDPGKRWLDLLASFYPPKS